MNDFKRLKNPHNELKKHIKSGRYQFTEHALAQMNLRDVIISEVVQSLEASDYKPKRDRWRDDLGRWSYTFSGKTFDNKELIIWISFVDQMLVVTVVNKTKDRLKKRKKKA